MIMLSKVMFAYFATVFFAISINTPKKSIYFTGINGAVGWLIYFLFSYYLGADVLGSFVGALVVALLSEYSARKFKMPATVFLTSGIIPLVPGAGLYYTMLELVQNNYENAINTGIKTIFISGSIAVAIAISSSIFKRQSKSSFNKNTNS